MRHFFRLLGAGAWVSVAGDGDRGEGIDFGIGRSIRHHRARGRIEACRAGSKEDEIGYLLNYQVKVKRAQDGCLVLRKFL